MSTKNGKKSRNRTRHDDNPQPLSFKQPPLDEIPLPSKPLKKTITPLIIQTITEPPITESPHIQETSNGNDSSRDSSRSNTPQKPASKKGLNGSGKEADLPNGSESSSSYNRGGGDNLLSSTDSSEVIIEPQILDSNELEPELLNLVEGSDSTDLLLSEDQTVTNSNKGIPRCSTRRSQTRYIPTPETPHSVAMAGGDGSDGTIANEGVGLVDGKVVEIDKETEVTGGEPQDHFLLTTPTITVTPSTPPVVLPFLDTSSTHESENTNLSDCTTDNCSTAAVVGSDVTRMNMDDQLPMQVDVVDALEEEEQKEARVEDNTYEEIEEGRSDERDGRRAVVYEFEERPRSREGSIARVLTGRKSIRPGTDYRKYLLERGMGSGVQGSYTSALGFAPSSVSGIKRKTTLTEFSTSTPNAQLKRRKLNTTTTTTTNPNPTVNWFSSISQSFYNLKNRFKLSTTTSTSSSSMPTLTAYKTKVTLEDTVDKEEQKDEEAVVVVDEDTVDEVRTEDGENVSLGVDALMEGDDEAKGPPEGGDVREIPVVVLEGEQEEEGRNRRKSCVVM